MKQFKKYKYIGRNGTLVTSILLDDVKPIQVYTLVASPGKVLTDGVAQYYSITIEVEDIEKWFEIDDPNPKGQD